MFANNSDFFDGSQGQSVIVRQPAQHEAHQEEDFAFPANGSSCLPSTPITPGYSGYPGQFPFPFLHQDLAQTFQSFFPPPDHGCNPALGNLSSPLLPGSALGLGGSLNHLNNRLPGVSRSNLPYDFPGSASNFMGGPKPTRKGGRRPGDEMVNEDCDPEEADKRQKRRQRNKEAAARCRQRRLDLMQSLQEQVARERDANLQKEKEIASVKQSLEKVVDFLRGHLAHLPETDKMKFEEIAALLHKDHSHSNGHVFKTEPIDPPSINDYLSQHQAIHRAAHKRSALPSASDISILEPELKKVFQIPKFDLGNPTLGQVNGASDTEVSRPTTLDISALQRTAAPLAATPSNGLYTSSGLPSFRNDSGMYSSLFNTGADGQPHFLCQSTGLTPSAAPTVGFVAQTPTPLQTSEADLRPL